MSRYTYSLISIVSSLLDLREILAPSAEGIPKRAIWDSQNSCLLTPVLRLPEPVPPRLHPVLPPLELGEENAPLVHAVVGLYDALPPQLIDVSLYPVSKLLPVPAELGWLSHTLPGPGRKERKTRRRAIPAGPLGGGLRLRRSLACRIASRRSSNRSSRQGSSHERQCEEGSSRPNQGQ